jgi:hypothetical protein
LRLLRLLRLLCLLQCLLRLLCLQRRLLLRQVRLLGCKRPINPLILARVNIRAILCIRMPIWRCGTNAS